MEIIITFTLSCRCEGRPCLLLLLRRYYINIQHRYTYSVSYLVTYIIILVSCYIIHEMLTLTYIQRYFIFSPNVVERYTSTLGGITWKGIGAFSPRKKIKIKWIITIFTSQNGTVLTQCDSWSDLKDGNNAINITSLFLVNPMTTNLEKN